MVAAVKDITKLVDRQMQSVGSRQSQEVAAIAEETSAGAEEVTATTSEQAIVMENVEKSAMELKVQAEKLNRTITRFHTCHFTAGNLSWFPASLRGKGWTSFIFS